MRSFDRGAKNKNRVEKVFFSFGGMIFDLYNLWALMQPSCPFRSISIFVASSASLTIHHTTISHIKAPPSANNPLSSRSRGEEEVVEVTAVSVSVSDRKDVHRQ